MLLMEFMRHFVFAFIPSPFCVETFWSYVSCIFLSVCFMTDNRNVNNYLLSATIQKFLPILLTHLTVVFLRQLRTEVYRRNFQIF